MDLSQQIAAANRKLELAKQELERAEKEKEYQEYIKEFSGIQVRRYLKDWLERAIDTGDFSNLDKPIMDTYWSRYPQDKEQHYIWLAARLLTHPEYGLVSNDTRVRNVSTKWLGKEYSTPEELLESIEAKIGKSPFSSQRWFTKLMGIAIKEPNGLTNPTATIKLLQDKYTKEPEIEGLKTELLTQEDALQMFVLFNS